MIRRYLNKSTAELQKIFESHQSGAATLQELLEELAFRRTASSRSLMGKVVARLQEIEQQPGTDQPKRTNEFGNERAGDDPAVPSDDLGHSASTPRDAGGTICPSEPSASEKHTIPATPPRLPPVPELFDIETEAYGPPPDDRDRPERLSVIRPSGTKGLPDAYVRLLKREIALNVLANADIPDHFIAALHTLIREIKRTGAGQRRYELESGHRAESAGGDILYIFPFTDEAEIFEDAQVDVLVSGRRIAGTIVSIAAGRLILALKEDVGTEVRTAVLLIDATALLEALRLKIEAVKKSEISLNRALADPVIGKGP
jgi:hypothetical protein